MIANTYYTFGDGSSKTGIFVFNFQYENYFIMDDTDKKTQILKKSLTRYCSIDKPWD
jgi:hypothetical protein